MEPGSKQFNSRTAERTARRAARLLVSDMAAVWDAILTEISARYSADNGEAVVRGDADTAMAGRIGVIEATYLKRVALPDWTITISAGGLALSLGARTYTMTISAALGVQAGDDIFVSPTGSVPAGFLVGSPSAISSTTLQVQVLNPLLAIGASQSITLKVFTIRKANP